MVGIYLDGFNKSGIDGVEWSVSLDLKDSAPVGKWNLVFWPIVRIITVKAILSQNEKSSPCALFIFNWAPRHGGVLGNGGTVPRILISTLDRDERSVSRLGRFTPTESAPDTHWIWGWVGPRVGLEAVVKRKIPSPCRGLETQSSRP
jgi:hypothetical protein